MPLEGLECVSVVSSRASLASRPWLCLTATGAASPQGALAEGACPATSQEPRCHSSGPYVLACFVCTLPSSSRWTPLILPGQACVPSEGSSWGGAGGAQRRRRSWCGRGPGVLKRQSGGRL